MVAKNGFWGDFQCLLGAMSGWKGLKSAKIEALGYGWSLIHKYLAILYKNMICGQMCCLVQDNYSPCCLVTAQPFPGSRYRWPSKERIGLMDHSNWCWEALRHIGGSLTSWKAKGLNKLSMMISIFEGFVNIEYIYLIQSWTFTYIHLLNKYCIKWGM